MGYVGDRPRQGRHWSVHRGALPCFGLPLVSRGGVVPLALFHRSGPTGIVVNNGLLYPTMAQQQKRNDLIGIQTSDMAAVFLRRFEWSISEVQMALEEGGLEIIDGIDC
jgi:hypothetical protein